MAGDGGKVETDEKRRTSKQGQRQDRPSKCSSLSEAKLASWLDLHRLVVDQVGHARVWDEIGRPRGHN